MSDTQWYAALDGAPDGPFSPTRLAELIHTGRADSTTLVHQQGSDGWTPLGQVAELAPLSKGRSLTDLPPLPGRSTESDEVDYRIFGREMQLVEVELDPGEAAVAEAGGMMYMDDDIAMETVLGDGRAKTQGLMGKLLGAGKRLLTGESLFMTIFSSQAASGKRRVAFAAPYPGRIVPLHLARLAGEVICQKDAFLCAAKGVALELAFQKRIGAGLFGGEGFIMQRLTGDGWVFLHAGGTIIERTLEPGQTIHLDTGCLVALTPDVKYDIRMAPGVKTALFGGEGLFLATLTGPGRVWLQSLPFSRLADRIFKAAPKELKSGD